MSELLQQKLFDYHAQPSTNVWDKIIVELDSDANTNISKKLSSYEVKPPGLVWENISASLNQSETPVVPIWKRVSKSTKYISAAASILAIAIFINVFFDKKTAADLVEMPVVKQNSVGPVSPPASPFIQNELPKDGNKSSSGLAVIHGNNGNKIKNYRMPLETYNSDLNREDIDDRVLANNYSLQEPKYLDRYMVFSTASCGRGRRLWRRRPFSSSPEALVSFASSKMWSPRPRRSMLCFFRREPTPKPRICSG
jgi:hypothetical protein